MVLISPIDIYLVINQLLFIASRCTALTLDIVRDSLLPENLAYFGDQMQMLESDNKYRHWIHLVTQLDTPKNGNQPETIERGWRHAWAGGPANTL